MSQELKLDRQAEMLANKIRHYLITTMGRTSIEANADEFYRAFSYALREEVMINWNATEQTRQKADSRTLYYLSMEYLPGRIFSNNITNLRALEIVQRVVGKLDRNLGEILQRESDPGLGNGGLGRLASCFLDSLATQHMPARAYGLRYQYGIFEQQLWDGVQVEAPDCWLINENPWEFRRDLHKVKVNYCGDTQVGYNLHGEEVLQLEGYEEVWALPYDVPIIGYNVSKDFSVATLRLWTTKESPRNFKLQRYNAGRLGQAAENTALTDVLYPSDHHETGRRIRLKQEFLLVSASLQDIIHHYLASHDSFDAFPDKVRIQINDTHPALIIPELIRLLNTKHDIPWEEAVAITKATVGYTNHTILKEALEEWDRELLYYLLPRQYKVIEKLNHDFCHEIRKSFPNDEQKVRRVSIIEEGRIRMANLSIAGSHKVNGVAKIHTELLKTKVFKDFYDLFPDKFVNITNGVTQRRWLLHANPQLADFITQRIGDDWITNFASIKDLAEFATDRATQEEFIAIKRENKNRFIQYFSRENRLRDNKGHPLMPMAPISIDSLFDVQIKRIHEYKRQLMNLLHLIMLYHEMLEHPNHKRIARTSILSGKAAAGYEVAKDTIRLAACIGRKVNHDKALNDSLKVVYIENYNVSRAEIIIPAAELSEQISCAGTEASGTGNMKLTMNGALTIGTEDGANIEMGASVTDRYWPFSFGYNADEIAALKHDPKAYLEKHPQMARAVESLRDHTFANNEEEHQTFLRLHHYLTEKDPYCVLADLPAYAECQRKVEILYQKPNEWAEIALYNIAGMGPFSTDHSIQDYSDKIWGLTPIPPDPTILEHVRQEYSKHDQCRIY